MRDSSLRTSRSGLTWIISSIIAAFILNNLFLSWWGSSVFGETFALSLNGLSHGKLWQALTYTLLHPAGSVFYVLTVALNVTCLYFLGIELEPLLGGKRFAWLFAAGSLVGAISALLGNGLFGSPATQIMGAWSAIAALFSFYACMEANQRLSLLFFFVPITIRPRQLAWLFVLAECAGFLGWEMRGKPSPIGVSHSAHLGGMLAGLLYYRFVFQREWRTPDGRSESSFPKWFGKPASPTAPVSKPPPAPKSSDRESLKAELDRILDKINSQGLGSLTAAEKRLLAEAKNILSRP